MADLEASGRKPLSRDERYQLAGWLLFIACALLYGVSAFVPSKWISAAGSLVFLLACFVFLVPLLCKRDPTERLSDDEVAKPRDR